MADLASRDRWGRRPAGARVLRALVFALPVVLSFGAAWAVRAALPSPTGLLEQAGSLALLVVVSTAVLLGADRLSRRALPLATLLDLSMLFPDHAPSRLGVAREAIRRRPIEEQLRRVREAGADPGAVAREILALVASLSAHDRPTRGHAERVRMFTDLLAEQMRIPARDRDLLRWAAILHDIGKLRVPPELLNKPGKPTAEEWLVLKAHPAHGAEMAAGLLPWLGEWGRVLVEHHERYDGTGYPHGLSGPQISIGARIVSVADAYDVMTAARAYKRPVSRAAALRELVRFSGSQFDPAVVRAMVDVGAPRLRRAQGVVAWLADVPLVASTSVPVATVARVVGAGALATGAVLAPGVPSGPFMTPHAVAGTTPSDPAAGQDDRRAGSADTATAQDGSTGGPGAQAGDRAPGATDDGRSAAGPTDLAGPDGSLADPAGTSGPPTPAAGTDDPASSDPGVEGPSGGNPPSDQTSPKPAPSDPADAPDPVGTVTDTVTDAVGTVGGVVDDVATDPVGTVTAPAPGLGPGTIDPTTPAPLPSPTLLDGGLGG